MAFSLIYAGEHYFSDILLGWIYTIVTVFVAWAAMRWWAARRAEPAPVGATRPGAGVRQGVDPLVGSARPARPSGL